MLHNCIVSHSDFVMNRLVARVWGFRAVSGSCIFCLCPWVVDVVTCIIIHFQKVCQYGAWLYKTLTLFFDSIWHSTSYHIGNLKMMCEYTTVSIHTLNLKIQHENHPISHSLFLRYIPYYTNIKHGRTLYIFTVKQPI